MEALFLLIPLSVAIIAAVTWLFLRMADQGQFEDLDSPGHQILADDDRPKVRDGARAE
jgi:cbb3-type cytochrome oxidase maturation protein